MTILSPVINKWCFEVTENNNPELCLQLMRLVGMFASDTSTFVLDNSLIKLYL